MSEAATWSPGELVAAGRRHLAVRDYTSAVETLARACEMLAAQHGDTADHCAEAYLWYGKSLLGLAREDSAVLGDGLPGAAGDGGDDEDGDREDQEEGEEDAQNGEAEAAVKENGLHSTAEQSEAESTTQEPTQTTEEPSREEPTTSTDERPGPSSGEGDESVLDMEGDDDVDNLQLAWEMLDLSRSILSRRVQAAGADPAGADAARALLADVHLALGEVALESETYDKAVLDMQSCLELQQRLYGADDRRIAETHYQIGLANSLSSNFSEAIEHFTRAADIVEARVATLSAAGGHEPEVRELRALLPDIREKARDMLDYKAETIKRVRESLCPSNGASSSAGAAGPGGSSGGSGAGAADISHLIKRKRKASAEHEPRTKKPAP